MSQALDAIADRSRIFVSGGSAIPRAIDRAMAAERDRWAEIELVTDRLVEPLAVFAHPNAPFRVVSLQPSPAVDGMRAAGALITRAVPFSRFGSVMAAGGSSPIDVAIVHVSQPGPDGRFSLGVSVATPVTAIASADLVIAQVNQRMPYSFGAGELDRDELDLLVEVDHPLVESVRREPDETAVTIGALVAELIPDRAMIQIGVGALADAVLAALTDHRDLGVHSGMISDGIVELHRSGATTGVTHPRFPGRLVTGLVGGTATVFEFIDRNPDVVMVPTSISHGIDVVATLPDFTAINSAVEVALDGSVNGEMIGDRVVSGPGGAPDYAAGAAAAPGGRFVVAMPATAAQGQVSRIVGELAATRITVPGHLVSLVVTEHGAADIGGLPLDRRAAALRAVAAPDLVSDPGGRPV